MTAGRDLGQMGKADGPVTADMSFNDATGFDLGANDDLGTDDDLGSVMPELEGRYQFELSSGEVFDGELVAIYDSSLWWNPGPGLLYGVFDPAGYAAYPNDRSMRFVWEPDVVSVREVTTSATPYREFLRQNDMAFRQPPLSETSFVITGNTSYHLEEDGFGDFAWDVERTNDAGQRFTGLGANNEDFLVWDEPVYSGVAGEVIEVVDSGVDNIPGSHPPIGTAVNNLVGIALGGHYYAYYLHFREGAVDPQIVVGTQVQVGDLLGRAGNSGVTLEPHIHMVVLWFDVEANRSYAVPAEFADVLVSQTPTGPFVEHDYTVPVSNEWVRASEP